MAKHQSPEHDAPAVAPEHDAPKPESAHVGHAKAAAGEPLHPFCQRDGETSQERADRIRKAHTQEK